MKPLTETQIKELYELVGLIICAGLITELAIRLNK